MSILKYIVPIRPGVSSKEDSDVRQTSGSTGSAEVILHSSESSSKPISGSNCNNSTHTHSYTSTAYTTPYAEWLSPEEWE